ncbi:hypothetical protein JMJ77_0013402, partial [Colletotrichum scovillei]
LTPSSSPSSQTCLPTLPNSIFPNAKTITWLAGWMYGCTKLCMQYVDPCFEILVIFWNHCFPLHSPL